MSLFNKDFKKNGRYDVDTTKYVYLESLWITLENHPEGITLAETVKYTGLDKTRMLNTIQQLAIEYNQLTRKWFTKEMITSMIGRAIKGDKVKDEIEDELVNSWIFDKCMLYARIEELNWIQDVNYPEEIQRLKKIWLERRGM